MSRDKNIAVVAFEPPRSLHYDPVPDSVRQEALRRIGSEAAFMRRDVAEIDEGFKQIIPYVVIGTRNSESGDIAAILSAQRLSGGNEGRLHGKIALGFGGHVKWDGPDDCTFREALNRCVVDELDEELGLPVGENMVGSPNLPLVGIVNDDTDEVGRVHLGLVFFLDVSQYIREDPQFITESAEPDKLDVFWAQRALLPMLGDRLEGWGGIVANAVQNGFLFA